MTKLHVLNVALDALPGSATFVMCVFWTADCIPNTLATNCTFVN